MQCRHPAWAPGPCIPGTNKLIAKQGQVHATLQHQPFLASVIDMVMMLSASQKASWPTSSLVIPSSGRHVPAQQKSGQFVYTTPPPPPDTHTQTQATQGGQALLPLQSGRVECFLHG